MESERIEPKVLIISVAAILCVEGTLRAVFSLSLAAVGAARLLEALMLLAIMRYWGRGLGSIGLDLPRILHGLKRGLIWSAGFALVALVVFLALIPAQVNALAFLKTSLPSEPVTLALFFLVGGGIAPVAEEIFFRGILYGFFRRWGFVAALVLSTMLFVLPHMPTQRIPLTQAVGGVVFAVAYEAEGSVMVPITIHVLGNTAIFTLSVLMAS